MGNLKEREKTVSLNVYPPIAYIGRTVFIIVAAIIFVVALLAYIRTRNRKTLWLTVGFGLFFLHGILSILELLVFAFNVDFSEGYHLLLDSIALLFILVGALRN